MPGDPVLIVDFAGQSHSDSKNFAGGSLWSSRHLLIYSHARGWLWECLAIGWLTRSAAAKTSGLSKPDCLAQANLVDDLETWLGHLCPVYAEKAMTNYWFHTWAMASVPSSDLVRVHISCSQETTEKASGLAQGEVAM